MKYKSNPLILHIWHKLKCAHWASGPGCPLALPPQRRTLGACLLVELSLVLADKAWFPSDGNEGKMSLISAFTVKKKQKNPAHIDAGVGFLA